MPKYSLEASGKTIDTFGMEYSARSITGAIEEANYYLKKHSPTKRHLIESIVVKKIK